MTRHIHGYMPAVTVLYCPPGESCDGSEESWQVTAVPPCLSMWSLGEFVDAPHAPAHQDYLLPVTRTVLVM
jgi:hypothetical protein